MIIPVRCFSCGSIIAHVWEEYNAKVDGGMEPAQASTRSGWSATAAVMYIGHIDLLEDVATYSATSVSKNTGALGLAWPILGG